MFDITYKTLNIELHWKKFLHYPTVFLIFFFNNFNKFKDFDEFFFFNYFQNIWLKKRTPIVANSLVIRSIFCKWSIARYIISSRQYLQLIFFISLKKSNNDNFLKNSLISAITPLIVLSLVFSFLNLVLKLVAESRRNFSHLTCFLLLIKNKEKILLFNFFSPRNNYLLSKGETRENLKTIESFNFFL